MCGVKACFARPFALSLLLITIASCGGSDSENIDFPAPSLTPNIEVEALNGIAAVTLNQQSTVDVSPFIYGDKNTIEIEVLNNNRQDCPEPIVSNLTFNITANAFARCDYQFNIKQKNNDETLSSATMQVLVTKNATDAYLSPMSAATIVGDTGTLVTDWEAIKKALEHYYIKETSFVTHTIGDIEEGKLHFTEGPVLGLPWIHFDSPNTSGWNYISYVAENDNLGEEKFGYIFISIADKANHAPVVSNDKWNYGEVKSGETVTISIAGLVEDADGDQWFLDKVMAFDANVKIVAKDSFTFESNDERTHHVSYMVRDEHNAYAFGTVEVDVKASSLKKFSDSLEIALNAELLSPKSIKAGDEAKIKLNLSLQGEPQANIFIAAQTDANDIAGSVDCGNGLTDDKGVLYCTYSSTFASDLQGHPLQFESESFSDFGVARATAFIKVLPDFSAANFATDAPIDLNADAEGEARIKISPDAKSQSQAKPIYINITAEHS